MNFAISRWIAGVLAACVFPRLPQRTALAACLTFLAVIGAAEAQLPNTFGNTGTLGTARYQHTATLLPDGRVLVAGGTNGATFFASVELYDPATGRWSPGPSLGTARSLHTATLLRNGKVLVAGGRDSGGNPLASTEIFDLVTGTWTPSGSLISARNFHTATLLPSGKVLVVGGAFGTDTELYDPATGMWTATGSLAARRAQHTATLLPSGKVLVAGGEDFSSTIYSSAELYDPAAGTWTPTGSMGMERYIHTATLLPNGMVLVAQGFGNSGGAGCELYDPAAGTWAAAGALVGDRNQHSATLLPNGKVLVVGASSTSSWADLYDPANDAWTAAAGPAAARSRHTATLLPSGKVLVVGGFDPTNAALASAELYDSASGNWAPTGSLAAGLFDHTATLLPDARVLVAGGNGSSGPVSGAQLYDAGSGMWNPTGSLAAARGKHSATLLPNGKVLVGGGLNSSALASCEVFEPTNGAWTATGSMATARYEHTATELPNGKVLVVGGLASSGNALASAELYNEATGTWTATASLSTARTKHTATLLPNGKVLVVGGNDTSNALASAELYDPATGTWSTTGNLGNSRYFHTATLLPNGMVLAAGGFNAAGLSTAEVYDPSSGTWTTTGSLATVRNQHSATLLPDGRVLVAGGFNSGYLATAELYDPASGAWTATNDLGSARDQHTATLLPQGEVLVSGGIASGGELSTAELWDAGLGFPASARPQISSSFLNFQGALVLTGVNFTGLSGGSSGNTEDSESNYPVVQLLRLDNEQSTFLPSDPVSSFSASGFTSVPGVTSRPGFFLATVFVNGIPSASSIVQRVAPSAIPLLPDIPVGLGADAVAINPVANKIYVANAMANSLTVVDGAGGETSTAAVGAHPAAVAVNALTGRVFVANLNGNSVSVLDAVGAPLATIPVGAAPQALAVDPVSNRIYTANSGAGTVSVIDGASFSVQTVTAGSSPNSVAVNPATGRAYVTNGRSNSVTVIDGADLAHPLTVATGAAPAAVAVNAATNRIYAANNGGNSVTVIDGATGASRTIAAGANPSAIAVNPVTNSVYVANAGDGTVTIIDGSTGAAATVGVGSLPLNLAIDPLANKVYVGDATGPMLSVIDGQTATVSALPIGSGAAAIAANPLTRRVYIVRSSPSSLGVLDGSTPMTALVQLPGLAPTAVAADPVQGRFYVVSPGAAHGPSTVTILNSALNPTNSVSLAPDAFGAALNPITGKLYVSHLSGNAVTALDLATLQTTSIPVGALPRALAVNAVTNEVYVTNAGSNTVTIINGDTNGTHEVGVDLEPSAVAVNTVTNKAYIANYDGGSVTVIDGRTHRTTAVPVGNHPFAIDVNALTNRVYVAGTDATTNGLAVLDGDNNVSQIPLPTSAQGSVAVNAVTNQIFVSLSDIGQIAAIEGATGATNLAPAGATPKGVAVDAGTDRVFVANAGDNTVSIVDARSLTVLNVPVFASPLTLAADPASGRVCVAHAGAASAALIAPGPLISGALIAAVDPLPGNSTILDPAVFDVSATSSYGPQPIGPRAIYYQFDTTTGAWAIANPMGPVGQAVARGLAAGVHTLYVFAADGQESTSVNFSGSGIPGTIDAYTFLSHGGTGAFSFTNSTLVAHSSDANVSLSVQRNFAAPASVDYQTVDGSALAGLNYLPSTGTLSFAQNQLSQTINIPLTGQALTQGAGFFSVQLSNPSGASVLGAPASAGVFLLNSASSDLTLSNLHVTAPSAAQPSTGSVSVSLTPADAPSQWRLYGETAWRASGDTAGNLAAGNYTLEFKPRAGYDAPSPQGAVVTAGSHVSLGATYTANPRAATGSLTVGLTPAGIGGWRISGELVWRPGGETASSLPPGTYLIEFAPAANLAAPDSRSVAVIAGRLTAVPAAYATPEASGGPALVPLNQLASNDLRYGPGTNFTGQVQTDAGSGSGVAALNRVVLTSAEALFDDSALTFASGLRWASQHSSGQAPPQVPRGVYLLDGYAAQRNADQSPGAPSTASQQLDAAAMYFLEPAAHGGQSGYLASNSASNPWLTNSGGAVVRDKFVAGYATDGSGVQATPLTPAPLGAMTGALFKSKALTGVHGFSGAPLFVSYSDPAAGVIFYPAGIYLGRAASSEPDPTYTVFRAIDAPVADLLERAEISGNGGANHTGGGVILVDGGLTGSNLSLGALNFTLTPAEAVAAGARWGFQGGAPDRASGAATLSVSPGTYTVTFSDVPGFAAPDAVSVNIQSGRTLLGTGSYLPMKAAIASPASAVTLIGRPFQFPLKATPFASSYSLTGRLPAGLALDKSTGLLAGTPTESGVFTLQLQASNSQGSAGASAFKLTVADPGYLQVDVSGNGNVPSAFRNATVQFQGQPVTITAIPAKGSIFLQWNNIDPLTGEATAVWSQPTYPFEMPAVLHLRADFVPNPYGPTAAHPLSGIYNGLLRGSAELEGHGAISLNVGVTGAFTGQIYVGSQLYRLAGVFDGHGAYAHNVAPKGLAPLVLNLQFDDLVPGAPGATGKLSGSAITSGPLLAVRADRASFSKTAPAPQALQAKTAAQYVLALPHSTDAGAPEGDGFGAIKITPAGAISIVGTLGDGSKLSAATTLGPNGEWPFFALPYAAGGAITGALAIPAPVAGTPATINGTVDWFHKNDSKAKFYPAPFNTVISVLGTNLGAAPLAGLPSAPDTRQLSVGGTGLAAFGPFPVTFDSKGNGTVKGLKTFKLKIDPTTGLFSGSFPDAAAKPRNYSGILIPGPVPQGFGLAPGDAGTFKTGSVEF